MKQVSKIETKTKLLLACGAIGCPLFILIFLIEGATRVGYDPLRHPVSSLAIGEYGWIQMVSFIITGLLVLFFSVGLRATLSGLPRRAWEPVLIGLVGIGLICSGFFTTDPVYGYPVNQPVVLAQFSIHGNLHVLFSLPVFICLPTACFSFFRRFTQAGDRGWAAYSLVSGIVMVLAFIISGMGFRQATGLVDYAGAFQRLSIIAGWGWITALALRVRKTDLFLALTNKKR